MAMGTIIDQEDVMVTRTMAMGTIIDHHFFTNAGCLMYTLPEVIWVGKTGKGFGSI